MYLLYICSPSIPLMKNYFPLQCETAGICPSSTKNKMKFQTPNSSCSHESQELDTEINQSCLWKGEESELSKSYF